MIRIIVFLVICLSAVPLKAGAQADRAGMDIRSMQDVTRAIPTAQDQALNEKVRWFLQEDASLRSMLADVHLKTVNGVVHLKGTVASDGEKQAIERKVRSLPGVSHINSFLKVQ